MRVVHVVPMLFGQDGIIGGGERYAFELARHMSEITDTTLVSFGQTARQETIGKLKIEVIGKPHYVRGQKTNPIQVPGLIAKLRSAQVVHCHQQHITATSVAAMYCRLTGRKVFVSDLGGGGWDISSYVSTDRWFHGHLHISEYSRNVFGHSGRSWAHVIFGGVDTQRFSPAKAQQGKKKVLFVGRIMPHKGIDYLVDALPEDLQLEIIGQPYHAKYYEDLRKRSVGKNVQFRHGCADEELIKAYQNALCVVLPSVYQDVYGGHTKVPELLGQTLLEGMACGVPGICTDVASMPEVVENNVTGFVVRPNDPAALGEKLIWLQKNPDRAKLMGEAAVTRVRDRFSWHAVAQSCLDIYAAGAGRRQTA